MRPENPAILLRGASPVVSLPRVASATAKARTRLYRCLIEGILDVAGVELAFSQTLDTEVGMKKATEIALTVGDVPVVLALPDWVIQKLTPLAQYAPMLDQVPDPKRLALAVEHLLTPTIEGLEERWGQPIRLTEVWLSSLAEREEQIGTWAVASPDRGLEFEVSLSSPQPDALSDMLAGAFARRSARSLSHITSPVVFYGPLSKMPVQQIASLKAGAVIFPCASWPSEACPARFVSWSGNIASVACHDRQLIVSDAIARLDATINPRKNSPRMENQDRISGASVVVTVELARTDMPISEVEGICEGTVLDFDIETVQTVIISASGVPVAEGRLLQLDDTVGIQVTKLR